MLDIGLHIDQNQNCTVTEYIMKLGKIRMSEEVLYIHRVSKIIISLFNKKNHFLGKFTIYYFSSTALRFPNAEIGSHLEDCINVGRTTLYLEKFTK